MWHHAFGQLHSAVTDGAFCALLQPNIDKNTGPDDWRYREAATFVFGCILEGPSPDQLAQLVVLGLNFLLQVCTACCTT